MPQTFPGAPRQTVISVSGLTAQGRHGVLPQEHLTAQTFTADVEVGVDAPTRDDIDDAVDYRDIAHHVIDRIETESVQLIETLADDILNDLLSLHRVRWAQVRVHKPKAPLGVTFADLSVSVRGENPAPPDATSVPA
ncbi:MAG: dihydroneopterin aldolase [Propionibacteriaceae bacterium]|nr:dihydroneopterin aldolase [Propionibacteriaceae bacterium]